MLSVAQAQCLVRERVRPLPPEGLPLTPAALGLVLAEAVVSDLDMPPYPMAMMDGFALRAADLVEGRGDLTVIEEVTAGQTPRLPVGSGQATRIMTGAPLPTDADAVVQVERTHSVEANRVAIDDPSVQPGLNVLPRGREMRRGEVVLPAGTILRPQEFGTLATVGRTSVRVYAPPRVALLSTGDEVVEAAQTPGPGQIRNSNGPMLAAQVARAGAIPVYLGIARDTLESLRGLVSAGLGSAVLVLSGGVSAGKLDLVPGVLRELGVEAHFHQVAMKPGKPVFFGTRGDTLVFGLPGNPVSALVCFELFVRPAIRVLRNDPEPGPRMVRATLIADFGHRSGRPTYHPARLAQGVDGPWTVQPVPWFGSPDLLGLTQANAFVLFPAGDQQFRAGEAFDVLKVEGQD